MSRNDFQDDVLDGHGRACSSDMEKREREIEQWFSYFAEYCESDMNLTITYKPDVAKVINSMYWELLNGNYRHLIKSKSGGEVVVDRHKIASLTELLIVTEQPITCKDVQDALSLNARLAYYTASNIIGNWNADKVTGLMVSESFHTQHLVWLRNIVNATNLSPVFSNAATWYLAELIYLERSASTPK
ncbi:MAG: hypothetical protein HY849_09550 [Nitrosomonadales bacterium]|nr:hypothetical protein [Nitrosomonadales bacterium]